MVWSSDGWGVAGLSGAYVNAEVNALAANITPAPPMAWLNACDTLVSALKTAGAWQTLDVFYCFAAPSPNACTWNWVDTSTGRLTENGIINYSANQYAASNGTTGWFSTTFALNSGKAVNGNAEFGYFVLNEDTTDNVSPFQSSNASGKHFLGLQASGTVVNNLVAGLNTSTAASFGSLWSSTVGHWALQQNDTASQLQLFLDGVSIGTSTQTTSADIGNVQIFRNSAGSFTTRRLPFVHYGSKLTAPQHLALSKALYTFLSAMDVRPKAGFLGLASGPTNVAPYKHVCIGDATSLTVPAGPAFTSGLIQCGTTAYPHGIIRVDDPNYPGGLWRLEVLPGDHWQFDGSGITRVQLNTSATNPVGNDTTVDMAFSFWIEAGSTNDVSFNDLLDFHENVGVAPNCGPTHAISGTGWGADGGKYYCWGHVNKNTLVNQPPGANCTTGLWVPCAFGQWHHVRTTFRIATSGGFCNSWLDGQQVLAYSGLFGTGAADGAPYWQQIALYRGDSNAAAFAVWYANIEFVTGSQPFASRINTPLPRPPL